MSETTINFAKQFTDCPGGSLRSYGEHSGQAFREDVLEPALRKHDKVTLNLNGVIGFPPSFVSESFGKLTAKFGYQALKSRLILVLDDDPFALSAIDEAMREHSTERLAA